MSARTESTVLNGIDEGEDNGGGDDDDYIGDESAVVVSVVDDVDLKRHHQRHHHQTQQQPQLPQSEFPSPVLAYPIHVNNKPTGTHLLLYTHPTVPDEIFTSRSLPMILFFLGFLVPPLIWIIGAVVGLRSDSKSWRIWGFANAVFAGFMSVIVVGLLVWGVSSNFRWN